MVETLKEQMEALSKCVLKDEEQVVYKEDHFFQNQSRKRYYGSKKVEETPPPGVYYPHTELMAPKKLHLWHDTVTRPNIKGLSIDKSN